MSSIYVSLMINHLSSASTQAAQTSILNLTSAVEQILQSSEDVSRRVASLETRLATPIRYADSMLRAPLDNDYSSNNIFLGKDKWDHDMFGHSIRHIEDREEPPQERIDTTSSNTPRSQNSPREQQSSSPIGLQVVPFDPTLESELYASRVYSRNTHRHSISSFCSTQNSATGLSVLSGLSISQVSTLSVVSLPILCHELWNPQQYKILQNSGRSAGRISEKMSKLRRREPLNPPRKAGPTAESTRNEQLYQMLKSEKTLLEREIKVVLLG